MTPVTTPAPAPASPSTTSYKIVAGDTVSALAARFGVTAAAILATNGMGSSTIIYSGRTLLIPTANGGSAPASKEWRRRLPLVTWNLVLHDA